MNPILFAQDATDFSSYGEGVLSDAISCIVTEERNGEYELELRYSIKGKLYDLLTPRSIIYAEAHPNDFQPFRIYQSTKPLAGIVTYYARHISYDMSGIPVAPFTAANVSQALTRLSSSALVTNPFTFWTDKSSSATLTRTTPTSMRSMLGGMEGSVLDVYGGEWKFDGFTARLYAQRGTDNGVTIRYGKNLVDLKQEENVAECYSGIIGYWYSEEEGLVQGDVQSLGAYPYVKIFTLDLSADYEEKPTKAQVNSAAMSYATANQIGIPKVSLSLSYAQLADEPVNLCDTVHVSFEALGVEVSAKVVRTAFNSLTERYETIDIGDARQTIAGTISNTNTGLRDLEQKTANDVTVSALAAAIDRATASITGVAGGYVVIHQDSNGKPYEILIMDTNDINTAQKVWRWNQNGLGYSSTGYQGTYGLAMTKDGEIVADFITTGTLDASKVTVEHLDADSIDSGTIDASVVNVENLDASNITTGSLTASDVTVGGFELSQTALKNGMTSLGDTTHDGVYLGTDGIALGKGAFRVTKNGALKATSGEIANFTIGTDAFRYLQGENGGIYIGMGGIIGSAGVNDYKFVLDPNTGKMSCVDADISGNLTVQGQQITAANLYAGAVGGGFAANVFDETATTSRASIVKTVKLSATGISSIANLYLDNSHITKGWFVDGNGVSQPVLKWTDSE